MLHLKYDRIVLLAVAALFIGVADTAAHAQSPASSVQTGLPPSLQFASEDASFYYALTNNRLKWDCWLSIPSPRRSNPRPSSASEILAAHRRKPGVIQCISGLG
ncbi:hypothetical protein CEE69_30120 [Rhodopirellula bahusiensis]|uniref:Uncharacterized protein n=1 Tax=Rhodopirellula bahusiensis TaxID=2014065 RepID=A0A2G1VXV6_9BACT|nr:hypothetical protein CEE69_30120 [Rhodopirellula bahusiensis]